MLVILGIAVFIASPPVGQPEMRFVFYVNDSATNQPIAGAALSVVAVIPGVGTAPLARVLTDSNGSASIAAPSSIFSVDVIKQGYQEYYVHGFALANTYVIHLGVTNATSRIDLFNSTRGGGFALPSLSEGQLGGVIVAATGVVLMAVAALRTYYRSHLR